MGPTLPPNISTRADDGPADREDGAAAGPRRAEAESTWVDRQDIAHTTVLRAVGADPESRPAMRRRGTAAEPATRPARRSAPREPREPREARRTPRVRLTPAGAVLLMILAVQTLASLRAHAGFTTSYPESQAVSDGHQMLHQFFHDGRGSDLTRTSAGAPFLAPVLFAVADSAGGGALVDVLIAALLGGATVAAYLTARRLRSASVGVIAAGFFGLTVTVRGSAASTAFAAASVCALAWAGYATVRYARGDSRNMLLAGVALMVLADYADYSALLWNVPLVASVLLIKPDQPDWQHGRSWNAQRYALLTAVVLVLCLLAGRNAYFSAITSFVVPHDGSGVTTALWAGAVLLALVAVEREPAPVRAGRAPRRRRAAGNGTG